jgi:hypothetical protein
VSVKGLSFVMAPVIIGACLIACTDASLETLGPHPEAVPDNKLTLDGHVCTESPKDLVFPLRVLFLVDCSESMEVNDPPDPISYETGREKAVRETAEVLLNDVGDVKISIIRFSAESQPITSELSEDGQFLSYFTDDLDYIRAKLELLGETDRTTNYIRALSEAYAEIRHEVMHSDQESLALSTYHVVMITDGLPDVEGDETVENSFENIVDAAEGITQLGRVFHLGRLTVNTALISSGNADVDAQAEELLEAISDTGGGTFRSFASGGELNFLYVDLTAIRRVFTLKTLVAMNLNAKVIADDVAADSDGDGLEDKTEIGIGSDPFYPDSDGDGCGDGMEYRYKSSGMDPIDPGDCQCFVPDYCFDENEDGLCDCENAPDGTCCEDEDGDGLCDCIDANGDGLCDSENYLDSDGDGLCDCEERYTGTNRSGPDTDGDGLCDFLEIRFGTNPDINDIADDFDWDSVPNGEEVKTATDPHHASVEGRSGLAYRYKLNESVSQAESSTCYDFQVSNITLTETLEGAAGQETHGPAGQGYSGFNRILVFAGEVPFDDLESYQRFRVACAEASFKFEGNYKNPPSGLARITDADFVELSVFDPEVHCIPPGGWK